MNIPRVATLVIFLFALSLSASPQDQAKGQPVAPNTKLQIFFSELETQWLQADQDKDQAAVNRIVADNFHLRTPTPPGNPIPRAEWLLGVFGRRVLSFQIRQLTVREVASQIAVVSFVETETYQQSATPRTQDHFVVDVWINNGNGDSWRCTDRYSSDLGAVPQK
jgi:Domain of unknown function (DUF4440)